MKRTREQGFVMVMVIVALGLLGVIMAVLGRGTTTMLFQADRAYLDAVERNLTASGLAWARQQIQQGQPPTSSEPVVLDLKSFPVRKAGMQVCFVKSGSGTVDVRIETQCAKSRQHCREERDYSITAHP